jgi:hypothetical protein
VRGAVKARGSRFSRRAAERQRSPRGTHRRCLLRMISALLPTSIAAAARFFVVNRICGCGSERYCRAASFFSGIAWGSDARARCTSRCIDICTPHVVCSRRGFRWFHEMPAAHAANSTFSAFLRVEIETCAVSQIVPGQFSPCVASLSVGRVCRWSRFALPGAALSSHLGAAARRKNTAEHERSRNQRIKHMLHAAQDGKAAETGRVSPDSPVARLVRDKHAACGNPRSVPRRPHASTRVFSIQTAVGVGEGRINAIKPHVRSLKVIKVIK